MVKSSIVFSRAAVDIVTKPYLVGAELEALALQASTDFVAALEGAAEFENPVSLEILNGCDCTFRHTVPPLPGFAAPAACCCRSVTAVAPRVRVCVRV